MSNYKAHCRLLRERISALDTFLQQVTIRQLERDPDKLAELIALIDATEASAVEIQLWLDQHTTAGAA